MAAGGRGTGRAGHGGCTSVVVYAVANRRLRGARMSFDGGDLTVAGGAIELVDAEKRFRALLEAAPDAMVIVDRSGDILLVNAQTESMFGYERAELLGQPVELLV